MLPADEIVQRAVAGDRAALKLLLVRGRPSLQSLVERHLPREFRSVISVEDVIQETHIQVFQGIAAFTPKGADAFDRWMATIALNRLRSMLRRYRTIRRGGGKVIITGNGAALEDSAVDFLDSLRGPCASPSRALRRQEAAELLQDALNSIPDHYRQALWLVHMERRTAREAAEIMGRSERAIHGLCRRGIALLRATLDSRSTFLSSLQ